MGAFFTGLYTLFQRHRWLFVLFVVSAFAFFGWLASKIRLEEDLSRALPDDPAIHKLNEIFSESKLLDKVTVTISLKDTHEVNTDRLVEYGEVLEKTVNTRLSPYIKQTRLRTDDEAFTAILQTITGQLPVFVDSTDYPFIDSLLTEDKLSAKMDEHLQTLTGPAGIALKKMIAADPAGIAWRPLARLRQMQVDDNFFLYDNCIVTRDGKNLLFLITPAFPPSNSGKNTEMLDELKAVTDSLAAHGFPEVQSSVFGSAVVSAGNANQLRRDSWVTQIFTISFLLLLFFFFFRRKRVPFVMLIPVAFGSVFALGMMYLIQGDISVIAIAMGSVVFGIAVNYSIHLFNHYRHHPDMKSVIHELSVPMTIGSFTTITGFFCLLWTKSPLLHDLGLFAALSLIGAALSALLIIPHLAGKPDDPASAQEHWLDKKMAAFKPGKKAVLAILILTLIFGYTARYVGFDADMMKMNFMSPATKAAEAQLSRLNAQAMQSVYVVAEGTTLDEALEKNEIVARGAEQLKQTGVVRRFSGMSPAVVSASLRESRIRQWNSYWTTGRSERVMEILRREGVKRGFSSQAFAPFENLLYGRYTEADTTALAGMRNALPADLIIEGKEHVLAVHLLTISPENRTAVFEHFKGLQGVTVVDRQYLSNKFASILNDDYSAIAWMTSIVVFIVLLITYGRIELALVAFIPMLVTWVWILGIMGLFGLKFNIINVVVSALIFGLGDDYSIFIMDGLLGEHATGKKNSGSYMSSIFLSAITTLAGLGVLVFAKHPALQSIALISIIGISSVVIHSMILIPVLFRWLISRRTAKGFFPLTFRGLLITVFAFVYFVFGCLLLTLIGFILLKLNPLAGKRCKYVYHFILSKFTGSLVYIMANVKKRLINREYADFSKPSVIICNHQGFLDILCTVMLHPKVILLTNKWVWNSPVFGAVVKMADYYPVVEGMEDGIEHLRKITDEGYSIVVFPEGTRSVDGKIARFHKGAFYLAEKLKLDLQPIVLHGTSYAMTKGDFLLKDATLTVKFLPRIRYDDSTYGTTYQERAKLSGRLFRSEYATLVEETETPDYHYERLMYQYIYKGPVLEWYTRIKLKLEENYKLFDALLPREGLILDAGCGYGYLAYMLHYCSTGRTITGVDYDEEKIAVAQHCAGRPEAVQFQTADVRTFQFGKYNAIIISDVLHYLDVDHQQQVMRKAIDALLPGGKLIIRDGNAELKDRQKGTWWTEFFSTKVFRFNKAQPEGLKFLYGRDIRAIAAEKGVSCKEIDNTRFTSNIIFVLEKKEDAPV